MATIGDAAATTPVWTYQTLAADFGTTGSGASAVTGLSFVPSIGQNYEFAAVCYLRTSDTAAVARLGVSWCTGLSDGVAAVQSYVAATGAPLFAAGNTNAQILTPTGTAADVTQSWPGFVHGMMLVGATTTGSVRIMLASETAGVTVTMRAGSYLRYRIV